MEMAMRSHRPCNSGSIFPLVLITCFWLGLVIGSTRPCFGLEVDWRSLSTEELAQFYLEQDKHGFNTVSKADLINHAWSRYLANDEYLDMAGAPAIIRLAKPIASSLSREQQRQLVSMLESRIVTNPEVYPDLGIWTVWRLRSIWSTLGVPNEKVYEWTRSWLVTSDGWQQDAGHGEINMLLDWSITVRNQAGYDMTPVLDEVYGYIRVKALEDPAWLDEYGAVGMKKMLARISDRITPEQRELIRQNLVDYMVYDRDRFLRLDTGDMKHLLEIAEQYGTNKKEKDRWVLDWFTRSNTWQSSTPKQLDTLYTWLNGLDDSTGSHAAMGELARLAARMLADAPELDGAQWYFRSLGALFNMDEQQTYLTELLTDEHGLPRRNVARVLNKAYMGKQYEEDWIAYIEQSIEASASQPDCRAMWMLIRAESMPNGELGGPSKDALDWVGRSIAAADSDEVRFECIDWIVNVYTRADRETDAVTFIKENAPLFKSEMFREQLKELERLMSNTER